MINFYIFTNYKMRRWLKNVKMIRHGTQSDPELKFDWIVANYWTVENRLFDIFTEELQDEWKYNLYCWFTEKDKDLQFNSRLSKNSYLLGDIFSQIKQEDIL